MITDAKAAIAKINGIDIHYLEMGKGPAVIFCHGFPELAFSWRHQLPALAAAGYRAIALDMRGHGRSSCPENFEDYTVLHTVGDVIGLLDHLEIHRAVFVGHDAGTTTAYHVALMRPDRVRAVIGLSVPFVPRGPKSLLDLMAGMPPGFYINHFQKPGVAEKSLEADVSQSLRRLFYANSGDWHGDGPMMMIVPAGGTFLDALPPFTGSLSFMTEEELQIYVTAYASTGFRGGLNGYRVFTRNWELTAPWFGVSLPVPSAFIAGAADTVLHMPGMREIAESMNAAAGGPPPAILAGAGHWIQVERPALVNVEILKFLGSLELDTRR